MSNAGYPPPQGSYPPPAMQLPTSTMAVISVISGILGFTLVPFLGSIIAVITGVMARGETRGNPPRTSGDGLATAGIVMGWIGIGLGVLGGLCALCAFTFPFLFAIPIVLFGGGTPVP